ncbi:hypothetical protein HYT04_02025, partial [Candidatus Kaiserbacteria bacterium]|nr:hypothetical protein [Candidatus Kaiserbacteria bacterium]
MKKTIKFAGTLVSIIMLLAGLLGLAITRSAHAEELTPALTAGQVTFQMNRLDSVRAFWARYYGGQVLSYRESGEEDLQDSIARCVLAYVKYKMKRLDTVILYAGREPGDETHLICSVFPVNEGVHREMCRIIDMVFISADEGKYTLTCGPKPPPI